MGWAVGVIGAVVGVVGAASQAGAQRSAGQSERAAAEAEAQQLEARARETVATATFNTERIRKRAAEIQSTQIANAAAGGAVTDVSSQAIIADTAADYSLEQLLAMSDAESSARKDRYAAVEARATGVARNRLANNQATATGLQATGQLIGNYASWRRASGGG